MGDLVHIVLHSFNEMRRTTGPEVQASSTRCRLWLPYLSTYPGNDPLVSVEREQDFRCGENPQKMTPIEISTSTVTYK